MANPDEPCQLCGVTRENHGDANHVFSTDGQLIPLRKGDPPRQEAPKERGETPKPKGVEELEKAFLRLNEVLLSKGVIDGRDLIQILGGPTT